jgi:F-type H+-transporting ATPase subunit c
VSINHPLAANILTGALEGTHMRNVLRGLQMIFMSLAAMMIATPAFGQAAASNISPYAPLAAGLGMALAAGLCGLAQGRATASSAEALARNPGARQGIFLFLILGLAFIESLALFTFVIIFLKVNV